MVRARLRLSIAIGGPPTVPGIRSRLDTTASKSLFPGDFRQAGGPRTPALVPAAAVAGRHGLQAALESAGRMQRRRTERLGREKRGAPDRFRRDPPRPV